MYLGVLNYLDVRVNAERVFNNREGSKGSGVIVEPSEKTPDPFGFARRFTVSAHRAGRVRSNRSGDPKHRGKVRDRPRRRQ